MNSFRRYLGYMIAFLLVLACEKSESTDHLMPDDNISFYVYDESFGEANTKAIVEDTQTMINLGLPLHVIDMAGVNRGDNSINDIIVNYNSTTGLYRSDKTWNTDYNYEFYAYAMSKGNGSGTSVALFGDYKGNKGHSVDIYQPTAYTHDDGAWSDYLLSYRTPAVGSQKPLVRLEMERITTGVELYISTPEGSQAIVTDIEFTNITRSMRYTISNPAVTDPNLSGIRNTWVLQPIANAASPVVNYSRNETIDVASKSELDNRFDSKFLMMRFIAVKQSAAGKLLKITYRINEKGSDNIDDWAIYHAEFDLSLTAVPTWEIGRKTRYYISLDTSVELEGVIAEWKYIDYVEGTFLPSITQ